jgi:hypothetical protein
MFKVASSVDTSEAFVQAIALVEAKPVCLNRNGDMAIFARQIYLDPK